MSSWKCRPICLGLNVLIWNHPFSVNFYIYTAFLVAVHINSPWTPMTCSFRPRRHHQRRHCALNTTWNTNDGKRLSWSTTIILIKKKTKKGQRQILTWIQRLCIHLSNLADSTSSYAMTKRLLRWRNFSKNVSISLFVGYLPCIFYLTVYFLSIVCVLSSRHFRYWSQYIYLSCYIRLHAQSTRS